MSTVQQFPLTRDTAERLLLERDRKFFGMLRIFLREFGLALRHDDRPILRSEMGELALSILELAEAPVTTDEGQKLRHEIWHRCQRIGEIAGGTTI